MSQHGGGHAVHCYARALLDLVDDKNVRSVCSGASSLIDVLEDASVRSFFLSPSVSKKDKTLLLLSIQESCKIERVLINFVCVAIENNRFPVLQKILKEFLSLVKRRCGSFELEITTARQVSESEERKILAMIESEHGKPGSIIWRIDPEILGGFIAKIGSLVIDASFSGCLQELERVSKDAICSV